MAYPFLQTTSGYHPLVNSGGIQQKYSEKHSRKPPDTETTVTHKWCATSPGYG